MELIVVLERLGIALLSSFIFGLDRQSAHKIVGFGTFIFVTIGACALSITATILNPENPLPLLSSIVTGIGFLGAGALIKNNDKIFGFTTAASVWAMAIFGLIIGIGQYLIGLALFLCIILIVQIDSYLEHHGIGSYKHKITIVCNELIPKKEMTQKLSMYFISNKILTVEYDKKNKRVTYVFLIEGSKELITGIPTHLNREDWFESCKIE